MEVRACKECGILFKYNSGAEYCGACQPKDEETFQKVKSYIRSNPGATTADVCMATGVTVKQVRSYIEDGRISANIRKGE